MANVLTVIARLRAANGKGDELAALLMEQEAIVRETEPGNLVYRAHRSTRDPDLFVCYEQYEDDAAFQAHANAARLDGFRERCERERLTDGPVDDVIEIETFLSMGE